MRAVVYKKPFEVAVEDVPKPELQHPDDIIVKGRSFCNRFANNHKNFHALFFSYNYMHLWKVIPSYSTHSLVH